MNLNGNTHARPSKSTTSIFARIWRERGVVCREPMGGLDGGLDEEAPLNSQGNRKISHVSAFGGLQGAGVDQDENESSGVSAHALARTRARRPSWQKVAFP